MRTAHATVCRDACRRPIPVRRGLHGFTPDRPPAKIGNLFERVLDREGFYLLCRCREAGSFGDVSGKRNLSRMA